MTSNVVGVTFTTLPPVGIEPSWLDFELPPGKVGDVYSFDLVPYVEYAVDSVPGPFSGASLPPGLTVSTEGLVTGTPTLGGTFNPSFTATDNFGSATTFKTVQVQTEFEPVWLTFTLPPGKQGQAYGPFSVYQYVNWDESSTDQIIEASGLPDGLTMDEAGLISGTPTEGGSYPVEFTAHDNNGSATTRQTLTVAVGQAPVWRAFALPPASLGEFYYFDTLLYVDQDPDGGSLVLSIDPDTPLPAELRYESGAIIGVVIAQPTTPQITFIASDNYGSSVYSTTLIVTAEVLHSPESQPTPGGSSDKDWDIRVTTEAFPGTIYGIADVSSVRPTDDQIVQRLNSNGEPAAAWCQFTNADVGPIPWQVLQPLQPGTQYYYWFHQLGEDSNG